MWILRVVKSTVKTGDRSGEGAGTPITGPVPVQNPGVDQADQA
jgi:hypothetical protein